MYNLYLTNNLHAKPLSARLTRGLINATIAINKHAHERDWRGRTVRALSRAFLFSGAVLTVPVALIESIGSFAIGSCGLAINKYYYKIPSERIRHLSVKSLSFGMHVALNTFTLFQLALKMPIIEYYTRNALRDYFIHISSAAITQGVIGASIGNPSEEVMKKRILNLFTDCHPSMLNDMLTQLLRDVHVSFSSKMREIPTMEEYYQRHPETREFVQDFDIRCLLSNPQYQNKAMLLLQEFLREIELLSPAVSGADPALFFLNRNSPKESQYQDHLTNLLKASFSEIYATPSLHRMLDQRDQDGKELLMTLDSTICIPLAAYMQYKELLSPVQCPEEFTGNLVQYNQRHTHLLSAKALVDALSPQQKERLAEKILRGADVQAEGPVQQAYLPICALASGLYQGQLMSRIAINLRELNEGNFIQTRSLFVKACQDALAEIQLN